MHTVLKRKLFTVPFLLRTQSTLEKHLKTRNGPPEPEMYPPILPSSSSFKQLNHFFHPPSVKLQKKVPVQRAEETGELQSPGMYQQLDVMKMCGSFWDSFSMNLQEANKVGDQLPRFYGALLIQQSCSAVMCKILGTAVLLGAYMYNRDATAAITRQRCDSAYGKGIPSEQELCTPSILTSFCLHVSGFSGGSSCLWQHVQLSEANNLA